MKRLTNKELENLDSLRSEEGLSRNSHATLEDIVDEIKKGGMCLSFESAFPNPGVD